MVSRFNLLFNLYKRLLLVYLTVMSRQHKSKSVLTLYATSLICKMKDKLYEELYFSGWAMVCLKRFRVRSTSPNKFAVNNLKFMLDYKWKK